ncbi:MAG TPA: ABC transporter ATP-binding protein [Caldisericia bacterium]|nr:ABC transporter ATP-binding protein [Caldisericia bacterium]HOL82615.1 ABC transporter ATP-binding protein [Caldisericia bacterium]HON83709.1 ABC transporter ATP-binding protein [Caldisericia bacterium]HPC56480.1 ABC transporter ATP-binding protein [Caldisericia bacterium]HPP43287.1 ABC transporter ATP-binding protein [Caldisericia bacterium]
MTVVSVNNLVKDYANLRAVDNISFTIEEGEIFGLIGPNGAGKTTTLRIMATILTPTSGDIKIFGYDLKSEGQKIREIVSYLPEEAGAYKNLTGLDYLNFMASLYANNKSEKDKFVENAIDIARLEDRIKDKISTYSKGMVRKLLLSRSLMYKPKLAILDEPTSGLDVINSIEIRKIIKSFTQNGTTVLLSSHNMLEVEFLSDRIALINKGKILVEGKPDDLKKEYNARNIEEVFIGAIQ